MRAVSLAIVFSLGCVHGMANPALGVISRVMALGAPVLKVENKLQGQIGNRISGVSREEIQAEIAAETKKGCTIYTYGLSPFSTEACALLDQLGCTYKKVELGPEWFLLSPKASAQRAELLELTGQSSLPSVWIGGEHVGGLYSGPGIAALDESGELEGKLKAAGAL
uniref:Glutaredoxin domain-containing protein n=1 Tax=Prymnesium polylepis TaxID=72548 RepID=A0A6V4VF98_9EUKA|mmetsp:Transcript_36364/g.90909  ORF Transcript_36364/g.90909 Transcript_36364/m.90909 type:complete len:167 (+) Transcript_36364:41-541(+)